MDQKREPMNKNWRMRPTVWGELANDSEARFHQADDCNIYVASERAGKREAKRDGLPPAKTKAQGE